ncbi:MAG: 2-oxoglutarate synthase [Desulfobacteraceae bacterium]|nr:2-oxoglutarate synthase [Desulfobacteraceae bacterium]
MTNLLNKKRPPAFCAGCAHDRVILALDQAFGDQGLAGEDIAMVSDIGCSGLFDTFFNTHAFHGLHGRALTYGTGIKMAQPELNVVVTMGDGGLGIGGAHVLSTCRRNIDVTLLVLNNFNYGMTGGQCSVTTPMDAQVSSGFLNRLEPPMDICMVAAAAGAPYVARCSAYQKDLALQIQKALTYKGFSLIDIWGVCPGRYTKRNPLTPGQIKERMGELPAADGLVTQNQRMEYGSHYRKVASGLEQAPDAVCVERSFDPVFEDRREVLLLGSAGQRIVTAGEILCLAGMTGGMHATQKNDYPITVLRGHSVSEVVFDKEGVGYTGLDNPCVVIALAPEGVNRRKSKFAEFDKDTVIIRAAGIELPDCRARVITVDFKAHKIKKTDWALAALAVLARENIVITIDMLEKALTCRFKGDVLAAALKLVHTNFKILQKRQN